jgi:hypothetical protein
MTEETATNRTRAGTAALFIVTRYTPENRRLGGVLHVRKGWHWWSEAISPTGEKLCSVTRGPFPSEAEALAHARAEGAGDGRLRVLIALEGGIVQGTVADRPGVDVILLDYDTEGADVADLFAIPQSDGATAEAFRSQAGEAEHDPAFIDGALAAPPSDPEARIAQLRGFAEALTEAERAGSYGRELLAELEALEALELTETQPDPLRTLEPSVA